VLFILFDQNLSITSSNRASATITRNGSNCLLIYIAVSVIYLSVYMNVLV